MSNMLRYMCIYLSVLYEGIRGQGIYVEYKNREWRQAVCGKGANLVGPEVFGNCCPETCNTSSAADRVPQLDNRPQSFWINGYLLWSPLIKYNGCFRFEENINPRNFTSTNSILECSRFCVSFITKGFLFLHKEICKCISEDMYTNPKQASTSNCNILCPGNQNYVCGGTSDSGVVYYSAYEVVNSPNVTRVGEHCSSVLGSSDGNLQYQDCQEQLPFICEKYNSLRGGFFSYNCSSHASSWYTANRECQENNEQLYSDFKIEQIQCVNATRRYWIGSHIEQKIVWSNDNLPSMGRFGCLSLYVYKPKLKYQLHVQKCNDKLSSLCYKSERSTEKQDYTTATSEQNTDNNIGTEMSNYNRIPIASIIAGTVGGSVVVMLIIITSIVIRRRRNKSSTTQNKTSTIPPDSDYYSEPHINNGSPEERHELVNNTENGVYNHLGDTDINFKPTETLYDIMQHNEDEYDVSDASEQRNGLKPTGEIYDVMGQGESEYDVGDASGQRNELKSTGAIYDVMDHNEHEYDVGDASGHRKRTDVNGDLYDLNNTV